MHGAGLAGTAPPGSRPRDDGHAARHGKSLLSRCVRRVTVHTAVTVTGTTATAVAAEARGRDTWPRDSESAGGGERKRMRGEKASVRLVRVWNHFQHF